MVPGENFGLARVVNVFDRSISFLLPFFRTENGETHHQRRYKTRPVLRVSFYGAEIPPDEMETARAIVKANGINFGVRDMRVSFFAGAEEALAALGEDLRGEEAGTCGSP